MIAASIILTTVLLSVGGSTGDVTLRLCNDSMKVVGHLASQSGRPIRIEDVQFTADATAWERDRLRDLLAWGDFCWARRGCVVNGTYDPPPPPMKCDGAPSS